MEPLSPEQPAGRNEPSDAGEQPRWLRVLGPLLGFASLSVALTWPLALNLNTHVIKAKWFYDSMVNLMVLGSRMHAAFGMSDLGIYDNYFCAPVPNSIVFNESHLGLFLLFAPYYLITQDPLLSYNLLLLTGTTLSAYFTYLLVRHLSGSAQAAVISAIAFAFSPYVFFEMGRIQLVSTQWIPLCLLSLHRAMETGKFRWIALLAAAFVMQLGSCMYYAMFLVLVLPLVAIWLAVHHRRSQPRFWLQLLAAGAVAGALALLMVWPYLEMRDRLPLTRSASKVRQYSGRIWHLASVYPENKTLSFLHDEAIGGAEPIAFPGFLVILLCLVALTSPLLSRTESDDPHTQRQRLGLLLGVPLILGLAFLLSLLARDLAAGFALLLLAVQLWRIFGPRLNYPYLNTLYLAVVLLSTALFLGPQVWHGDPEFKVRGLYYYLYTYVPTFDSIRYVSRLAVMISIAMAILAGLGAARVLRQLRSRGARYAVFAVLVAVLLAEFLNAPVSLARLPSKDSLPSAHAWLAEHPGPEPVAIVPAYPKGFNGARNDYLTLFHRRRTVNGKSSWMAPITYLWIKETTRFPTPTGIRMLKTLGVKYLVLNRRELSARRTKRIADRLGRLDEFQLRHDGPDGLVYEIVRHDGDFVGLLDTPPLPPGAVRMPSSELKVSANRHPELAHRAIDGDSRTTWATRRNQRRGDWFQFELDRPRPVAALELTHFREAFDAPLSFRLMVSDDAKQWQTVFRRDGVRMFVDQVYSPKNFVFRVVLPEPTSAKFVRLELLQPITGRWWTMHEAALYAAPE